MTIERHIQNDGEEENSTGKLCEQAATNMIGKAKEKKERKKENRAESEERKLSIMKVLRMKNI